MISIIIPAYNSETTLARCLEACLNQTCPDTEIIVVDDGSADAGADVAARLGVRCIRQANQGPAAARNRGATAAGGDILVFTDADCVPEPEWLERLLTGFKPGIVAAGGTYGIANPHSLLARMVHEEIAVRHEKMKGDVDFLGSFNVAVEAGAFRRVGGFDESFRKASAEDNDLAYRLQDAGGRLAFVPGARVAHYHPERFWPYLRTQARHGYWRVKLYMKHRGRASRGDRYAGAADLLRPPLALCTLALAALLVPALLLHTIAPIAAALVITALAAVLAARCILGAAAPLRMYRRTGSLALLLLFPRVAALRDYARGLGLVAGVWRFVIMGGKS